MELTYGNAYVTVFRGYLRNTCAGRGDEVLGKLGWSRTQRPLRSSLALVLLKEGDSSGGP